MQHFEKTFFSVPVFSNLTKQLSGHFEALPAGGNGPVPLEEKGAELPAARLRGCRDRRVNSGSVNQTTLLSLRKHFRKYLVAAV